MSRGWLRRASRDGLVAARLAAARLVASTPWSGLSVWGRCDGLARAGLRRLGAAAVAATAAAAAAASRRLGAVHRRIGDWVHTVTLFLGEPGVVGRHVALRPLRAVLRRAGVGCGFAW